MQIISERPSRLIAIQRPVHRRTSICSFDGSHWQDNKTSCVAVAFIQIQGARLNVSDTSMWRACVVLSLLVRPLVLAYILPIALTLGNSLPPAVQCSTRPGRVVYPISDSIASRATIQPTIKQRHILHATAGFHVL